MADSGARAPLTVRQLFGLLADVPDFDAQVEIVVDGVVLRIVGVRVDDEQRIHAQAAP